MAFTSFLVLHFAIGFTIWAISLPLTGVHQPWDTFLYSMCMLFSLILGFAGPYRRWPAACGSFLGMWLGQMTALYTVVNVQPRAYLNIYWVTTAIAAMFNVALVIAGQEVMRSLKGRSPPAN